MLPYSHDMSCGPINQWRGSRFAPQEPNTDVILEVALYDPRTLEIIGKPQQAVRSILCWNEDVKDAVAAVTDKVNLALNFTPSLKGAVKRLVKEHFLGNSLAEHELTALILEMAERSKNLKRGYFMSAESREQFLELNNEVTIDVCGWIPVLSSKEVSLCLVVRVQESELQETRKAHLKKLFDGPNYKITGKI